MFPLFIVDNLDGVSWFFCFVNEIYLNFSFSGYRLNNIKIIAKPAALVPCVSNSWIFLNMFCKFNFSVLFWKICPTFVGFIVKKRYNFSHFKLTIFLFKFRKNIFCFFDFFFGFELVENFLSNSFGKCYAFRISRQQIITFRFLNKVATLNYTQTQSF